MYKSALTVNDILSEQQTVKLQCAKIASAVFLQNTGRSVVVSSCVKICARQRNKKVHPYEDDKEEDKEKTTRTRRKTTHKSP